MTTGAATEAGDAVWLRVGEAMPAAARREAALLADRIGLGADRAGDLALAVTEAATNLQRHSDDGALVLRIERQGPAAAVEFLALDSGPGIGDIRAALIDGNSTAGTLGLGLGAINRLADVFAIHSQPGRGTALLARFYPRGAAPPDAPGVHVGGLTRPINGEELCGDTWAAREEITADGVVDTIVMMCDGLGHGPLAARVADTARLAFRESRSVEPARIVQDLHARLKGTRGAAVAVARVDRTRRRVQLSGAGNISGFVLGPQSRQTLMSIPGIVGHSISRLQTFEADLPTGSALVLHSDGLSNRWVPADFPGLLAHGPVLIAGQLLWQAGTRGDDAGIVVVKAGA
ncbi:Anti-sigma regulatory factor (Ser/Thr protein kinase) [Streptomyces sp. DvalAA-14]|uniref:ATP-binding SpoIIE family protein phosphatase n=1 Tax=unclassified Streptomyces TaxID=2593676 RepID=UPI00081AFDCA|nr:MULTISPECIES: ATP-binding SpoIIE family protein phosphatase [unclassified Streptomyces]MYS23529.1 SpoIIE family protein phosphatase [Streptomyces sp. SID4948]SCE34807.1 Anti-sigma regulatory factor (Ser/Thr protein kinase) [Streptomyces sp. DvalAA-14]